MPKPRDVLVKARWAGKEVTLRSIDDGKTFVTSTGEQGVLLSVQHVTVGKYVARIEHRPRGNSWAGEVKRTIDLAIASLQHEVKRISRAGNIRPGGV